MKLKKPIAIDGKEIDELKIEKEGFTASALIKAEKEFLVTGGVFPAGAMEDSRAYMLCVAAKILGYKTADLEDKLSGEDFITLTNVVKGFYGGMGGLNSLIQALLEK
ncbi:hypothetical protein SAMN02745174_02287 [Cetobacterium ceti]|uniref:Phage tail assembly chaperone protein, E, or 41 or 14 n=1 Tax=Cetobacterium ceti TaxID=180163 RepID=A0A1T4QDH3_9FUSO|nr:phage tail assembly protein [Cetobacterium ceti]SKA01782.1 hypothetical protein SAMN02745174_02287 [Cetobacterium ceti]